MTSDMASLFRRLRGDESGAVAVLVAIALIALLGLIGLAIDMGNMIFAQRRLQATTDMAALAAALDLPSGNALTTASTYSAQSGDLNAQSNMTVTMASGYPHLICATGSSVPCTTGGGAYSSTANAIEIQQDATVSTIFSGLIGTPSVTISATAYGLARGGALPPLNIAIVLDNTASMENTDPTTPVPTDCGVANPTRIDCAMVGIQTLLSELWPTQDDVALFVFPSQTSASITTDVTCSGTERKTLSLTSYSSSSIYQVAPTSGLTNNYKTTNTSALQTPANSSVVASVCQGNFSSTNGEVASCGSCYGLYAQGGEGTYLAGAISAAQNVLFNNSAPNVQNVMIVISDGGAGNGKTTACPSGTGCSNQCQASISAAQSAAATGTWVYSIAYGSSTVNSGQTGSSASCSDTESPAISSCNTMADIASDPTKFYSDPMGGTTITDTASAPSRITGNGESGSTTLAVTSLGAVKAGMSIADGTTPTNIQPQSYVTAVAGTTVTLNQALAGTVASGDQIIFGNGACISTDNPSPTDLVQIFKAIGTSLQYTTLMAACVANNSC
jgi:Flp pilus assembly protein TadG